MSASQRLFSLFGRAFDLHSFGWISILCLVSVSCCASGIAEATMAAQDATTDPANPIKKGVVDFERDVAPILKKRCETCHRGEEAKGGFVVGDRDSVMGYVQTGDAASSSLWTDYLTQPPKSQNKESLVMPPDGPLPAAELAVLKLWIDEGASWPADASLSSVAEASKGAVAEPNNSIPSKLYRATAPFHPAIVHFPIALFVVSGACAFFSYFLGSRCQSMAFHCLWIAALSSIVSVVMGWAYADMKGYPAWNESVSVNATHEQMTFFWHRWLGTGLAAAGWLVVFLGLLAGRSKAMTLHHVWRMGAIVMALLVSLVGHQGGELVHGDIVDKALEIYAK